MRLVYLKPELDDLSQGQRISFARQIRLMTQDDLSDKLGITGENKRRTMTRYEKGERNPKEERTRIIADILKRRACRGGFEDHRPYQNRFSHQIRHPAPKRTD